VTTSTNVRGRAILRLIGLAEKMANAALIGCRYRTGKPRQKVDVLNAQFSLPPKKNNNLK